MWIGVRSVRRAQLAGTSSVCGDMAVSVGVAAGRTSFERGCSSSGSGGGGAAVTGDQPPQPAGRATDRDVCLMQLRLRAELEACTSSLRPTDRHQKNSLPHTHTHTHTLLLLLMLMMMTMTHFRPSVSSFFPLVSSENIW